MINSQYNGLFRLLVIDLFVHVFTGSIERTATFADSRPFRSDHPARLEWLLVADFQSFSLF